MKKFVLVFSVLCSAMAVMAVEDGFNATVTASKLNVRIKPTIKAPKAGTLLKGERVKVTREENFWVELEAPQSLKLYVSEVYLVNGKLTNSVNLRTARDAKSPSLGLLPAGTKLEAAEENSVYGWIKVKAPAGIKVYAYKDYIAPDAKESNEEVKKADPAPVEEKKPEAKKADPAPVKAEEFIEAAPVKKEEVKKADQSPAPAKKEEVKKPEAKKAVVPAKKAEVKKAPAKKAEVKKLEVKKAPAKKAEVKKAAVSTSKIEADLKDLGAKFDKDNVSIKGILYSIPKSTTPATNYAVLQGSVNQGFVCGPDEKEFKKLEGKEVNFTGKAFRIPGWKAPIILVK